MARPAANIITSIQINDFLAIDILEASALWVIMYKDQPFSIRQRRWSHKGEFPKYLRTVFPHRRSAENSAKKLNQQFNTRDFTVKKII